MSGDPMSDNDQGHGNYVRKVLDESRRYGQELLEENNQLRTMIAGLQAKDLLLEQQVKALELATTYTRELKEQLYVSQGECRLVREQLSEAQAALKTQAAQHAQLQVRLKEVYDKNESHSDEFDQLQRQSNNLANLYVASYRLHGTLSRQEVLDSIKEIVANLIGSEEMLLFDVDWAREELVLVDTNGVDPVPYRNVPLNGGLIGAAVRDGSPIIVEKQPRGPGEESLTAVIPLQLASAVTGAIAIFRLLPQKAAFEDLDRELFDLLASHAAMALHCTELHERYRPSEAASADGAVR
jgi:hypothetical protein